jgi:4-hydroxybenzoate polyprenyltransferase
LLKHYLQLFRVPNIFTVPSDILAGYFVTSPFDITIANYHNIMLLAFSSIFLYIGGMITNDLFDINTDKIERPNRPLSSGKIKKPTAISLAMLFFGMGMLLASLSNLTSTMIAICLVVMILLYNFKMKNGSSRPFFMGGIRSLNIVYGASSNFEFLNLQNYGFDTTPVNSSFINLSILTAAVFVHVFTLTLLSKRETEIENKQFIKSLELKKIFRNYLFLLIMLTFLGTLFLPNKTLFLTYSVLFLASITIIIFNKTIKKNYGHMDIQFLVKSMLVLLIFLDASYIAGSGGLYMGLLSLGMIIPCIAIGKKVSMT